MSFKIGLWIFLFANSVLFHIYLLLLCLQRFIVLGVARRNPTVKLKYNKLSMEKNHNMERELKNIVLIFIYMYYLKPSENMFEVK